ncbi:metal ABC transporter permease [uncultured Anaerococcus sp.]|uniref:metal ABC transporter permease n=1 Tax=uncultured Anaerococcus sp. TaxID=293428 RepID=UPI0026170223|nr:metal ABC transporter permease [uncultured Anaerococcus sp.]
MLEFNFMRRSLLVGIMIALIIPMIGVIMVNRKTSMIGDALSHSSLAGIGFGLILGVNPMWTSLLVCVLASFSIELIRAKFKSYGDMATALVMSTGIGIAAILSDFTPGGTSFESFMFGSITTVSRQDVTMVGIIFLLVALISFYFYYALLYNSINPTMARLAGVKTRLINNIFTFITAITVAISSKTVGALMITSLMTIPVALALLLAKSYMSTYSLSLIFSLIFTILGISASYYLGIKPGGAIVLVGIGFLIIASIVIYIKNNLVKTNNKK